MPILPTPLTSSPVSRHLALLLLLALPMLMPLSGCIRSRVLINSEPSEAEVIWQGEPYGATPVEIPFIWYWHHEVALEKPGYKRLETTELFRTPPWFLMPFDLLMEVIPVPIPDTRERTYVLEPLEKEPVSPPVE